MANELQQSLDIDACVRVRGRRSATEVAGYCRVNDNYFGADECVILDRRERATRKG